MDAKDLKSTLAYSMKYEATIAVLKTSRHVRSIEIEDDISKERDNKFESLLNRLEKLFHSSIAGWKNTPRRNPIMTCWSQVFQKGVLVAVTLVDLKREAISVRALNLKNKPKIVDKGAVIATCEPVVDIVSRPQEFSEAHLPTILENLEILNEEQRREVRKLLKEFQNLFSTCDADVGRCNMTQHRINAGDHPP
ncbi:hypothetical protein AVEN_268211-1 [Araneus ventricosus]|uniref:Uncharacterized protein n=1 Tax=Araneus ventricosus TaxID=182803 RepID=A0A4Y2P3W6_ARAVE|nr:hypothetical protein AVEN_117951-1 [Araneus ventricosus]GBN46594.1 hypothetical protein AVEN_268211-1 [Araneus ventricosus]